VTKNITAKICEVNIFCTLVEFFSPPFWPFPWQRQPFLKNQPLKAQLYMAYDIPTGFHKV
jgi:hypothetical protein